MLVLTRKVGDIIAIGDNIKIVVMAIKGKQVRLGVEADRNTIVHREEIYQKIKQETNAASQSSVDAMSAAKQLIQTPSKTAETNLPGKSDSTPPKKNIIIRRAEKK